MSEKDNWKDIRYTHTTRLLGESQRNLMPEGKIFLRRDERGTNPLTRRVRGQASNKVNR
jgi:hypothetical protein